MRAIVIVHLLSMYSLVLMPQLAKSESEASESYLKLYHQMQLLQEEVMRLQGQVDRLVRQNEKLRQKQKDDYLELDQRIRELNGANGAGPDNEQVVPAVDSHSEAKPASSAIAPVKSAASSHESSFSQYKHAYSLIKEKKFTQAKMAFKQFIQQHPNDQLVANCHYWLGELYILDGNKAEAYRSFETIISHYPNHNKKPEAMYKLGRLYFDEGKKDKAKQQMELILQAYQGKAINAVRLAGDFLKNHY